MAEIPTTLQALFAQSPAVALALLIWWYGNRDILRLLQERREIIEALRTERKEWMDALRQVLADYRADSRASVETKANLAAELHSLKNKMTDLVLKVEMLLMRVDGDKRKTDGND